MLHGADDHCSGIGAERGAVPHRRPGATGTAVCRQRIAWRALRRRRSGSVPRVGRTAAAAPQEPLSGNDQQRAGGGFLAGAAQTAMGVAGGVLLGNAITGMFGGSQAQATELAASQAEEGGSDQADDAGSDGGGDFGDIDF
ncbi:DUF2076 family protein [Mesorhizobium sp.]|uniref:DUF2076 family protein n=1 Tax=Mesorhizobium sp. TaxID=1871066 RepID=UPI00257EFA6D|nr:DUF2076 family protein [Mesorhizobium sp.]